MKYNRSLDFVKGLACIFVVWMHCEFPGEFGRTVQAISRFCVPFFFMVSGYFSKKISEPLFFTRDGKFTLNKKVSHILKITLWSSLFYLLWAVVRYLIWKDNRLSISLFESGVWLVFNQPAVIGGHLWFLFALLYDYILVSLFDSTVFHKRQFVFGAVAMVLLFVLGQGVYLSGIRIPNFIYRNWLIEGLAFFMLGRWINTNEESIKISNPLLLSIIVVSTLLCLAERQIMGRDFGVNICTLPQVFALFVYAVKNPERHSGFIQRLGKDCSMLVYIVHIFVWQLLVKIYSCIGVNDNVYAKYLLPLLVVIISILIAFSYNSIVSSFSKKSDTSTNN